MQDKPSRKKKLKFELFKVDIYLQIEKNTYITFREIGRICLPLDKKILVSHFNICWFIQNIILIFHQKILFPLSM
jgi:hypothetical protein